MMRNITEFIVMSVFYPLQRISRGNRGGTASLKAFTALTAVDRDNRQGRNLFVIAQGQYEQLQRMIFGSGDKSVFAVLDGAIIDNLPARLQAAAPDAMCLFSGDLDPLLAAAAPYLVQLSPNTPIAQLALRDGWGEHWGIILTVDPGTTLHTLRAHLRRVLRVKTPDGSSMLFRFYDPRAFRSVIPTLDTEQRASFYGPIQACYAEGRAPGSVLHFLRNASGTPHAVPLAIAA